LVANLPLTPALLGSIQCLSHYVKIRVFRNSQTRSRESNEISQAQTKFTRRDGQRSALPETDCLLRGETGFAVAGRCVQGVIDVLEGYGGDKDLITLIR
jgi:hypothetical protein